MIFLSPEWRRLWVWWTAVERFTVFDVCSGACVCRYHSYLRFCHRITKLKLDYWCLVQRFDQEGLVGWRTNIQHAALLAIFYYCLYKAVVGYEIVCNACTYSPSPGAFRRCFCFYFFGISKARKMVEGSRRVSPAELGQSTSEGDLGKKLHIHNSISSGSCPFRAVTKRRSILASSPP